MDFAQISVLNGRLRQTDMRNASPHAAFQPLDLISVSGNAVLTS